MEFHWLIIDLGISTAGLSGTAEVVSIAGGSGSKELEAWRARMLEAKQLGQGRDREADLARAMKSVAGVGKAYIYKKRVAV